MHSSLVNSLLEKDLFLVDDPLGNTVSLNRLITSRATHLPAGRLYDEACQLIGTPAFMIHNIQDRLYYFRSFGHNSTMLLEVIREGGKWIADCCILNPGAAHLGPLLRAGKPVRVASR
jgi:hypothetical protein